jgi:hypothetical protein
MKLLVALSVAASLLLSGESLLHGQLTPYRDSHQQLWGYRDSSGAIVVPPRFFGAGDFADGRAPVEDSTGFALVDTRGQIIERVRRDSVVGQAPPSPPPHCTSADLRGFPSEGLQCYAEALRTSPAVGGVVVRRTGSESASSAVFYRFDSGVVLIEERGYEGFRRRLLLPGVSAAEAAQWRRLLYPDVDAKLGCSEHWTSGAVLGGAYIEQHGGC